MRKIKFRAWDKMWKKMFRVRSLGWISGGLDFAYYFSFEDKGKRYEGDDCKIMQYTGLKDKNGVEIYEGDVLFHPKEYNVETIRPDKDEEQFDPFEVREESYVVIEWDEDAAGFEPNPKSGVDIYYKHRKETNRIYKNSEWSGGELDMKCDDTSSYIQESEVIGNIYENPELKEGN